MMTSRSSGVLLHPTSLANNYPIGDLGPAARAFANDLYHAHQQWWQMLPIGPTGGQNSPYDGPSAFAGHLLLISPDELRAQGLIKRYDFFPWYPGDRKKCNYNAALRLKQRLLRRAFERFQRQNQHDLLDAFIEKESYWLNDYALFQALRHAEGSANWTRWPDELKHRKSEALANASRSLAENIRYEYFVQWQFDYQWQQLKQLCNAQSIKLIGDMPLFVSHQSADVWAHQALFKLDESGQPRVVAGVPPDYFSPTGQLWNVPVYCWEHHAQENYAWWIARIRKNMERFDCIRLDHFIGYVHTYEIPTNDVTAERGQYQPGGGLALFNAVEAAVGSLPFIAEDLGARTADVDALRQRLGIPGMHVLQFDLEGCLNSGLPPQGDYPQNTTLYTGTHDNDTMRSWFMHLAPHHQQQLREQLQTNTQHLVWAAMQWAFATNANLTLLPLQDILDLGSDARMNRPGEPYNNWQWRMKKGALTKSLVERLKSLTDSTGRQAKLNT